MPVQSYRELGASIARKDFSEATLQRARKVAAAFPKAMKPRFLLGNLEAMHGNASEALRWLEPLVIQDPRNSALWQNLGELFLRVGRRDDAVRAFQAAARLDPKNEPSRRRLQELGARP